MYTYMFMPMILSLVFINLNHPMLMMLNIIIQTMFICLLVWMVTNTSWFSYILFLIFLGGLMVLFIYICSLASNESFKMKINIKIIVPAAGTMILMSSQFMMNQEVMMMSNFYKMMADTTMMPTIISMFYLLVTLIVVVKITGHNFGPIRSNKK